MSISCLPLRPCVPVEPSWPAVCNRFLSADVAELPPSAAVEPAGGVQRPAPETVASSSSQYTAPSGTSSGSSGGGSGSGSGGGGGGGDMFAELADLGAIDELELAELEAMELPPAVELKREVNTPQPPAVPATPLQQHDHQPQPHHLQHHHLHQQQQHHQQPQPPPQQQPQPPPDADFDMEEILDSWLPANNDSHNSRDPLLPSAADPLEMLLIEGVDLKLGVDGSTAMQWDRLDFPA